MKFFNKIYFIILAVVFILSVFTLTSKNFYCVSSHLVVDETKLMEVCGMNLDVYLSEGFIDCPDGRNYVSSQGGGCHDLPTPLIVMYSAIALFSYTLFYSIIYFIIKKISKNEIMIMKRISVKDFIILVAAIIVVSAFIYLIVGFITILSLFGL